MKGKQKSKVDPDKKHLQNCQSCQNHHQSCPHHHLKDVKDNQSKSREAQWQDHGAIMTDKS